LVYYGLYDKENCNLKEVNNEKEGRYHSDFGSAGVNGRGRR